MDGLPQSVELDPDYWVLNKANDITGIEENSGLENTILAIPNPFKNIVEISYTLTSSSYLSLMIFNELGQEVDKLADGFLPPGTHSVSWNAEGHQPGIYFYQIKLADRVYSGKLILSE